MGIISYKAQLLIKKTNARGKRAAYRMGNLTYKAQLLIKKHNARGERAAYRMGNLSYKAQLLIKKTQRTKYYKKFIVNMNRFLIVYQQTYYLIIILSSFPSYIL